jgi:hypothetical protein
LELPLQELAICPPPPPTNQGEEKTKTNIKYFTVLSQIEESEAFG